MIKQILRKKFFYTTLFTLKIMIEWFESLDKLSKSEPFLTYRIINKSGTVVWVEEFGDAVINNGKFRISRV
jgi:hypothetical protein